MLLPFYTISVDEELFIYHIFIWSIASFIHFTPIHPGGENASEMRANDWGTNGIRMKAEGNWKAMRTEVDGRVLLGAVADEELSRGMEMEHRSSLPLWASETNESMFVRSYGSGTVIESHR